MENPKTKLVLIIATVLLAVALALLFFAQQEGELVEEHVGNGVDQEIETADRTSAPREIEPFDFERGLELSEGAREAEGETGGVFMRNGEEWLHYENERLALAFEYRRSPNGFVLIAAQPEEGVPTEDAGHLFALLPEVQYRNFAENPTTVERPSNISIAVYPIERGVTARDWVTNDPRSNFRHSGEILDAGSEVGGVNVVTYAWSSARMNESVAVAHGSHLYLFSVGYDSPTDPIYAEFQDFLLGVQFLADTSSDTL